MKDVSLFVFVLATHLTVCETYCISTKYVIYSNYLPCLIYLCPWAFSLLFKQSNV